MKNDDYLEIRVKDNNVVRRIKFDYIDVTIDDIIRELRGALFGMGYSATGLLEQFKTIEEIDGESIEMNEKWC